MQSEVQRPETIRPGHVSARVALLRAGVGVRDPATRLGGQRLGRGGAIVEGTRDPGREREKQQQTMPLF